MYNKTSNNNNWSQDAYIKAWDFATLAHHGQTYGGPIEGQRIDYINHVGSVAMELIWALNGSPELNGNLGVQCALLHDVIEDTEHTYDQVKSEFGEAVANGVMALTKDESLSTKREQMIDSLNRIKQQPLEVWMVKLSDRITNLSAPPAYWSAEKRNNYKEEAVLILDQLGGANDLLAKRINQRIDEYAKYIN